MELLREVEVRRLDALQAALWDASMAGNMEAVIACLKIILARIKVLGLEGRDRRAPGRCQQPQTVILLADDCRDRGCRDHTC